jgi:DNA-binding IclR family transcriptional regulator
VGRPQTGLRSDTTRAVLEVMETLFPRAVTAAELAPLLGLPREKITQHLIILVGRDLLVQPSRGSYRYRPRTPPPAPDAAERSSPVDPAFVQTVLDILRADLTLD